MSVINDLYTQASVAIGNLRHGMEVGAFNGIYPDYPIWWSGKMFTDGADVWFAVSVQTTDDGRRTIWVSADGDVTEDEAIQRKIAAVSLMPVRGA